MKNAVAKFKRTSTALAAICLAASATFGADDDKWTGNGDDNTKWNDPRNWDHAMAGGGDFVFEKKADIAFDDAYSVPGRSIRFDGNLDPVTFTADNDAYGITSGNFYVGWGTTGELGITNGIYVVTDKLAIGMQGNHNGTLRMSGGSLTAKYLLLCTRLDDWRNGGPGHLYIDGGQLTVQGGNNDTGVRAPDNNRGAVGIEVSGTGSFTANTKVDIGVQGPGTLTVSGNGVWTATEDATIGAQGTLTIEGNGTVGVGNSTKHKWLKVNSGSINLNGGKLSICSIRAEKTGAAINLNGGTLYVYANNSNASGKIIQSNNSPAANVLAGGAIVEVPSGVNNTAFAVPLVSGVEAGETDGGFTKRGAGNFTLAANNTYNGPTVLEGGKLTIPAGAFATYGALVLKGGTLTDNETAEHAWSSVTIGEGATYDKDLTGVPNAADGKCILDGGTINLNAGDTLAKTLTVKSGTVAIAVSGVSANTSFTVTGLKLDTGVDAADVISMSDKSWGWNYAVNAEAGTITATAYIKYITPGSSSITWTDSNAWQNEDSQSVTFQDGDIVRFTQNASVAIPSETTVSPASITISENVEVAISGGMIETASLANSGTTTISSELTTDVLALNAGTLTLANTQTPYVLPVPTGDGLLGIGDGATLSLDWTGAASQTWTLSGEGTFALQSGQTLNLSTSKTESFAGTIDVPQGAILNGAKQSDNRYEFGTGKVRVAGGRVNTGDVNATITNDIEVASSEQRSVWDGGNANLNISGALTGDGEIYIFTTQRGVKLQGVNTNFCGNIEVKTTGNYYFQGGFDHWYSASPKALWQLTTSFTDARNATYPRSYDLPGDANSSEHAIRFGALSVPYDTTVLRCVANPTYMVVGERDADASVINGRFNQNALYLTKAGANTLTLGPAVEMVEGSTIDVAAGELVVNSTNLVNATVTVESGATLSGTGTVASVTFEAGSKLRIPEDADESQTYALVKTTNGITFSAKPTVIGPAESKKGKWRVKTVTVTEEETTYTVLQVGFVKYGFMIRIADSEVFLNEDAGLTGWLAKNNVPVDNQSVDYLQTKNSNHISPLAAYLLGYDGYSDSAEAPAIAAPAVTAEGFALDYDLKGKTKQSIDGIALEYAIESSNDNATWSIVETTRTKTPPVTLAFASAGVYNRLVADIVLSN